MSKIITALKLLRSPRKIFPALVSNCFLKWIPDKIILQITYRCNTGEKLHIKNPLSFNEKLQWLKLYDRKPEYNIYVDKYAVREYIKEKIGEQYLIPLIGVYEKVENIPWNELPNQFVLKCTHGSGCNIICTDKSKLDIPTSIKQLNKWMRTNYYWKDREWPYKDINPRIICEKYMVDESNSQLKDYKVFCFDGKAKAIQVHFDRFTKHKRNLYSIEWEFINATIGNSNDPMYEIAKPIQLIKMLHFAEKISDKFLHLRVDFYSINNLLYFGEMTFFHGGGYLKFVPYELGIEWGNFIKLPNSMH